MIINVADTDYGREIIPDEILEYAKKINGKRKVILKSGKVSKTPGGQFLNDVMTYIAKWKWDNYYDNEGKKVKL